MKEKRSFFPLVLCGSTEFRVLGLQFGSVFLVAKSKIMALFIWKNYYLMIQYPNEDARNLSYWSPTDESLPSYLPVVVELFYSHSLPNILYIINNKCWMNHSSFIIFYWLNLFIFKVITQVLRHFKISPTEYLSNKGWSWWKLLMCGRLIGKVFWSSQTFFSSWIISHDT